MAASLSFAVDHVVNPDHDALKHRAVFQGVDGNFFCVECASERWVRAIMSIISYRGNNPDEFELLAELSGYGAVLSHGSYSAASIYGPLAKHRLPPSSRAATNPLRVADRTRLSFIFKGSTCFEI